MIKIIVFFISFLFASIVHCMQTDPASIRVFDPRFETQLASLMNEQKGLLFHPKQPDPIGHALQCIHAKNFFTYLKINDKKVSGGLSMGIFDWTKEPAYLAILFVTYRDEATGRALLAHAIKEAKELKFSSITLFNIKNNASLRRLCIELGASHCAYSKEQEIFEFAL